MWSLLLSGASSFVSTYINYIKIGLAIMALCFASYLGYSFEHSKLVAYKTQVEAAGKIQEAHNQEVVREQKFVTEKITNDYKNQLARVHSYYGGLHDSSSGSMSSPSNTLVRVNGYTTDPVFAEQCASTTAQLISLQEWVREQVGIK
jgi:ABC-type anion transport system duplicated permease subunit